MEDINIPTKLIQPIRKTLENILGSIRKTENFKNNTGFRKSDILSTLFYIILEDVIRKMNYQRTAINKEGQILVYADDLFTMTRSRRKMEQRSQTKQNTLNEKGEEATPEKILKQISMRLKILKNSNTWEYKSTAKMKDA